MSGRDFPHHMLREIYEQAETVRLNLDANSSIIQHLAHEIADRKPTRLYAIGCGDSHFTAMIAKYAFGTLAGIPTFHEQSYEMLKYVLSTVNESCLVLAYSNSGETQKTIEATEALMARNVPVIGFTSNPESRLARAAQYVVVNQLPNTPLAAPHTTSYIANLTATLFLSVETAQAYGRDSTEQARLLQLVPDIVRQTTELAEEPARRLANKHRAGNKYFVLGGGPHYSTALGGAAKLFEAAYLTAIPQELEEFAHEQMFLIEPGDPVLIVTSSGASKERAIEIAEGARDLKGDVVIVSEIETGPLSNFARLPVVRGAEAFEPFTALTHLIPLELYAYYLAVARDIDPDRIRYFDVNMRLIGQGRKKQAIEETSA